MPSSGIPSDGRIPIDNNVIERLLRPVAIGRKNYLFFGSEHGGKTAATLYTLVQSARRNCVDVWPYLTDVLRRIAAIAPGDTAALEALLPDRWVAAHPEHRLEQREEESREAQARRRRKRAARRHCRRPIGGFSTDSSQRPASAIRSGALRLIKIPAS